MLSELILFILWRNNIDYKEKNLLFSVYTDANVLPKARVEDLALGQISNFFRNTFYM